MATWWRKIFSGGQKRSTSYDLKSLTLAQALGIDSSVAITERSVMSIAAFYAGVMAIAEDIAMMPWFTMQRKGNGKYRAPNHPVYPLLKDSPHPNYTSQTFRRDLIIHMLIHGNGYAYINRGLDGRPESFEIRHPKNIRPYKGDDGMIWYDDLDRHITAIPQRDMIHIRNFSFDGVEGCSVMSLQRDTLKSALSSNRVRRQLNEKGLHGDLVIELPEGVKIKDDEQDKRIRDSFKAKYMGVANADEPIIMPLGAKLRRLDMPAKDLEFLASTEFSVEEIARMLSITAERIQHHKNSTNNNIEKQAQEYVTYGLQPRVTALEQEINRKAFSKREKGRYYNKIELKSLMRGDIQAHTEFLKFMVFNGIASPDEVREMHDMNPLPEGMGEMYMVQTAMMPLDMMREYYESQMRKNEPII